MASRAPLTPMAQLRWPLIERALDRASSAETALEIGYGQGAIAQRLGKRFTEYRGYEPDRASHGVAMERVAGMPGVELVNAMAPDRPDRSFGVLCAFEVLEHIEDDRDTLKDWARWLQPGGLMILSVPAHQSRFGPADALVGHFRRYGRRELRELMANAGFREIRVEAYGFPLGLLLEAVRNRLAARHRPTTKAEGTATSGRFLQPKVWLGGVIALAVKPFALLQRPFLGTDLGTGFVVSAVRGSDSVDS